jgi:hypothetical protein
MRRGTRTAPMTTESEAQESSDDERWRSESRRQGAEMCILPPTLLARAAPHHPAAAQRDDDGVEYKVDMERLLAAVLGSTTRHAVARFLPPCLSSNAPHDASPKAQRENDVHRICTNTRTSGEPEARRDVQRIIPIQARIALSHAERARRRAWRRIVHGMATMTRNGWRQRRPVRMQPSLSTPHPHTSRERSTSIQDEEARCAGESGEPETRR